MTLEPLTCPYCNTLLPPPPGAASGQRILCPRCGDSFVLSAGDQTPSAAIHSQPEAPKPEVRTWPLAKPIRANRRLAVLILGIMACIFAGALAFALSTQEFRRQ